MPTARSTETSYVLEAVIDEADPDEDPKVVATYSLYGSLKDKVMDALREGRLSVRLVEVTTTKIVTGTEMRVGSED